MRSRDGDNSLTLTVFKLIFLFLSVFLYADEYLISYRYVVRDAMLYNENLSISKAMKKCNLQPTKYSLVLENNNKNNLKTIIIKNKEKFITFIQKLPLSIQHQGTNINFKNNSTTIITLKTRCFKVDFNENFAKITPLQ